MNRVAIGFTSKDRCELSRQTIEPLQNAQCALFWFDGSNTKEGDELPLNYTCTGIQSNVRGGADAAVAYALTHMLKQPQNFTHIGLCENDVLLTDPDWFGKTMALFERGAQDGLKVGAVSARAFEDRILIQRDGYAVMHNLGFGQQILTREAVELSLKYFRTGWTHANRLVFSQLSGVDIGAYWAFRGGVHAVTADWNFDTVLGAHGLASLALVPSPVDMIGQVPSLAEMGLAIAREPVEERRDGKAWALYGDRLSAIRNDEWRPAWSGLFHQDNNSYGIYPHQIAYLGGKYRGDWILRWSQGFGPFAWRAGENGGAVMRVPVLGPCDILVSGGEHGGKVHVKDSFTGFEATPELFPESSEHQVFSLGVPAACAYRNIELTMLTPGTTFFGIRCREAQPVKSNLRFDATWLPPTA